MSEQAKAAAVMVNLDTGDHKLVDLVADEGEGLDPQKRCERLWESVADDWPGYQVAYVLNDDQHEVSHLGEEVQEADFMPVSEHREEVERLEEERNHAECRPLPEELELVLARLDALLADLKGEVERLRGEITELLTSGFLKDHEEADGLEEAADRLQALIDKHAPKQDGGDRG